MNTNAIKNPVVILSALLVVAFFLPWFGLDLAELGAGAMGMISGMAGVETPEVDMTEVADLPSISITGWTLGTIPLLGMGFVIDIMVTITEAAGQPIPADQLDQIRTEVANAALPPSLDLVMVLLISPILAALAVLFGFIGGPMRTMAFLSGLVFILVFILMMLGQSEMMAFASFGFWLTLIAAIGLLITPFIFKRKKAS